MLDKTQFNRLKKGITITLLDRSLFLSSIHQSCQYQELNIMIIDTGKAGYLMNESGK
jgi:hypothetical protein